MVVVMKPGTRQQDIDALVSRLKELDLDVGITNGVGCTILGLVGDTTAVDMDKISINPHVERVMRVQEPYKKANRKFHPEDTVVSVGNAKIGGGNFSVIAGPCSVESEAQICASLSTEQGPAITEKFPPPILAFPTETTVSSGWNLRLAFL